MGDETKIREAHQAIDGAVCTLVEEGEAADDIRDHFESALENELEEQRS